jgi:hypothetical protein
VIFDDFFGIGIALMLSESTSTIIINQQLKRGEVMNGKRWFTKWWLSIIGLTILTVGSIQAQILPPIAAFRLTATVDEANAVVNLSWNKPSVDTVVKYYVYRWGGMASVIQLIDSTTGLTFSDKPPLTTGGGGMLSDGLINTSSRYMFTYFVRAKTPTATLQSTSAVVFFSFSVKKDVITFLTTPVTTGQVGILYTAKVMAKSSDSTAKLTYILDQGPKGMTLDTTGGTPTLKWTPASRGMYFVRIIVASNKNGSARQEYFISVAAGNGIVYGIVTDTTMAAKPIANVIIQIMDRDRALHFTYSTVTNAAGEYRINRLDPGTYILHAIPTNSNFIGQWYNGKNNADIADKITVSDSTSPTSGTQANFKLLNRIVDTVKFVVVKGSVHDTLNNPIHVKGTEVVFSRAEFVLNSSTSMMDVTVDNFKQFFDFDRATDFRIDGDSRFSFHTGVDSSGNYSLKLPQGSYIALARAPGYASEFYKEHADLLSANILKLTADSSNINFTLAKMPPIALSTLSGSVMDTVKNIGVRARVIAYRDGWRVRDGFAIAKSYFADTDTLGNYTLTDMLPGAYIVQAIPMGNYAPAYYTGGLQTTGKWNNVAQVLVDSGRSITGIDIVVKEISASHGGFTWITGNVMVSGKAFGLAGALVFATDKVTGEAAGYGVTDNSGNYAILGLAPSTYTVSVDKPGFTSSTTFDATPSYSTALTGSNSIGVSNVSFSVDAVTSVEAQPNAAVPTSFTVEQNYPNPFNPSTKIQFMLPSSQMVKVKVFDLLGREVTTLVNRVMTAGTYTVEWNAASMPSGVYFYRVEAGSSSIIKKMVLLK